MVALDNIASLGQIRVPRLKFVATPLVAGIALIAAGLVVGALVLWDFSDNGFRLGSRLAWRYACFVFFALLVGGPACRIAARFFPDFAAPSDLSRQLVWGFCASYGVYLLSVFLPNIVQPSAGASLMILFGGCVALTMAFLAASPAHPSGRSVVDRVRRTMLVTAAGYFWLCYSIMALARLSGPHRPDGFYGVSLCLMVIGLLIRYADRWISDFAPGA